MNNNDILDVLNRSRLTPKDEDYRTVMNYLVDLIKTKQYNQFDHIMAGVNHFKLAEDYLMMIAKLAVMEGREYFPHYKSFITKADVEIFRRTNLPSLLVSMGF